VYITTNI